jgi:hypothetical protein
MWLVLAGFVLAAAAVAALVASGGSDSRCDVKIGGTCTALKPGSPADRPPWPSRAAEQAIDLDPPNHALSARCRFRGIALSRYDFYRCRVRYFAMQMEMALARDRRMRRLTMYEFRILGRTGARRPLQSLHGRCTPRIALSCRDLP